MENTLGKRIAQLRREKGFKQDDLAQMLDISPQAVSKWENDLTCPDISLLPKLAQILEVTVDELLSGKAEPVATVVPIEKRKDIKDMTLRVVIDSTNGEKVRVNIPMSLVKVTMEMGMEMPQISGNEALNGIDFTKLIELAEQGAIGNLVEVESSDGDIVRVFVE